MKKYHLTIIVLFIACFVFAQTKDKPKEKPPTQKEMDEAMKEMQKALDEMSPEDKRMMDSMGIKMPSLKSAPKVGDKQLAAAYNNIESNDVPAKDNARIASISNIPLTIASLQVFLQSVHEQISQRLGSSTKETGENVYQLLKKQYQTATAVGNGAIGSWVFGKPAIALYVMSKACKDDPADDDNLNNFAAMLSMAGGEQWAMPLLTNLDTKYPNNSTILNNIAHAWFGLGDIEKASKYIIRTLALSAEHPQANMLKARIALSKGNKAEAIAAVKHAIAKAYSDEKENKLDKLGYKLKSDDLNWDRPIINDGLGLTKFRWPAYPKDVLESERLQSEWEDFIESCNAKIEELNAELVEVQQKSLEAQQIRMTNLIAASHTGSGATVFPQLATKAFIKLAPMVKGIDAINNFTFAEAFEPVVKAHAKIPEIEKMEAEALDVVNKKFEKKFGEGKENPFAQHCEAENAVKNNFLIEANTTVEQQWRVYLNYASQQINNILYYRLYTQWPDEFEVSKLIAQISWLTQIKSQQPMFRKKSNSCLPEQKKDTASSGKLQSFDDIHCQYVSESNLLFGTIEVKCGKITAKLDIGMTKLMLKTKQGDKDNETFLDQFQSCSIEMGYKKGVSYGKGPLKFEAKVGVTGYLEIGKTGITDAGVKIGADIKVGTNIVKSYTGADKTSIKTINADKITEIHELDFGAGPIKDMSVSIAGTEVKISMMTGVTAENKGILSGIK